MWNVLPSRICLHILHLVILITIPEKAAYGDKPAPLRPELKTTFSHKCQMIAWSQAVCALATLMDTRPLCLIQGVWAFGEETNTRRTTWKSFYGTLAAILLSSGTKEKITITLLAMALLQGPPLLLVDWPVSWYLFYIVDSGVKSVRKNTNKPTITHRGKEVKEKGRNMSSFYLLSVPFAQTQGRFVQQFATMRKCTSTLKLSLYYPLT